MSEVEITIQEMSTKEGTSKTGKPYTLLNVTDDKGERYSAFGGKWNQHWKPGETVKALLEMNGQYKNLKPLGGGGRNPQEVIGMLGSIDSKLNKVIDMIADLKLNKPGSDDLPF